MPHTLGQADVQQALNDINGLRQMLPRVPNESLRAQLMAAASQCQSLLEQAMTTDADAAPGLDCVVKLYEAFEEAKRVPAATPQASQQTSSAGGQGATILWIVAAGAALVGVVAAVT